MSIWAKAAPTLHRTFADPISYTGAGLDEGKITGIKRDVPADAFQGPGSTARHISFEIQKSDLPQRPAKGDIIVHVDPMTGATDSWRVIDRVSNDVGAWVLSVEKA